LNTISFTSILTLITLALIWGSSFILMKIGLKASDGSAVLSGVQVACLRMIIAAIVLSPFAFQGIKKLKKNDWPWLMVVGLCGSGIPAFLFAISQQYIDSGLAGILNALTPVFTLLIGLAFFKKTTHTKQLLGMAIGFIGAAGIIAMKGSSAENAGYALLIILATVLYGVSVNTVGSKLQHVPAPVISSVSLSFAAFPCSLIFLATPYNVIIEHPEGLRSFFAIATLAVFGTGFANILFFKLTQKSGAVMAASVTYLIPLVAVGWGVIMGESIGFYQVIFGAILLGGVYLTHQKKIKR
jgi:drug/metabolite transporter (DMT)-like permease